MISNITAIATDCDYVLMCPSFTQHVRPFYRLLKRMSDDGTEIFLKIISGLPEYIAGKVLFRYETLFDNPTPLVDEKSLAEIRNKYKIGVYSRRPKNLINKNLAQLGYSVDVVVGQDDVGIGTIRREYVDKCLQHLNSEPETTLIVSDSPKDIEKGRLIGAMTCAVTSGYHSEKVLRECKPDIILPSFQELLEKLNTKR